MMSAHASLFGRMKAIATVPVAALVLGSCAPADSELNGASATDNAPSFVSLNPCTDAILVAVAKPEQILALSHYSRDPRSSSIAPDIAERFAMTGGTAEEVMALAPDTVLAGTFLQPSTAQAFRNLGLDVQTFGIANEVEASFAQIRRIAGLARQEWRGESLIADITASLEDNSQPTGDAQFSAVLWQPGQIVPGEQTLITQLMTRAGFSNHSAASGLSQADYLSLERVLVDPPQLLLVAGDTRAQQHPALAELRDTVVERFDPGLLYCDGPTIIRAMDRLGAIRKTLS